MMFPTVALKVRLRLDGARDRLGNAAESYAEPEEVPGCLFAPGTPEDLGADGRPDGARVSATAHFPKGYEGDLRGALVSWDGAGWYRVVGEPVAYPPGCCPGKWNLRVPLERVDG